MFFFFNGFRHCSYFQDLLDDGPHIAFQNFKLQSGFHSLVVQIAGNAFSAIPSFVLTLHRIFFIAIF